jgi:hypothetical protein
MRIGIDHRLQFKVGNPGHGMKAPAARETPIIVIVLGEGRIAKLGTFPGFP